MARGDLLVNPVRASVSGDKSAVRSAAETLIAEEKSKQHVVLAGRLTRVLQANGSGMHKLLPVAEDGYRGRGSILRRSRLGEGWAIWFYPIPGAIVRHRAARR